MAFILETVTKQDPEWLLPLAPGLYENKREYVVVTAKGQTYVFPRFHAKISTSLEKLCLSDFKVMDEPFIIRSDDFYYKERMHEEIAKILPAEELEKARKPRPFSPCLVGRYGGMFGIGAFEDFFEEHCTVEKDGKVQYHDAYSIYRFRDDEGHHHCEGSIGAQKSSRVKSVSRSAQWSVTLRPGPDAHVEAHIPPLCLLELENGRKFDLGKLSFTMQSALLSSTSISYPGHIQEDSAECPFRAAIQMDGSNVYKARTT